MSDPGTWLERLASPGRWPIISIRRGCSSMVEQKLPKLTTRVRFPSPAPIAIFMLLFCACLAEVRADAARFAVDHPFTLIDSDGTPVSDRDFPGKFLLIYFGYTHCVDQCPPALSSI